MYVLYLRREIGSEESRVDSLSSTHDVKSRQARQAFKHHVSGLPRSSPLKCGTITTGYSIFLLWNNLLLWSTYSALLTSTVGCRYMHYFFTGNGLKPARTELPDVGNVFHKKVHVHVVSSVQFRACIYMYSSISILHAPRLHHWHDQIAPLHNDPNYVWEN